jgi:hypothetical protein
MKNSHVIAAVVAISAAVIGTASPARADASPSVYWNETTSRCLDDSTAYGNDVLRGFQCDGLKYQEWYWLPQGDGSVTLQNVATDRCLDDSTANGNDVLRGYQCNGLAYQEWAEVKYSDGSIIFYNVETQRCLDDSTANGNDVLRAYQCNYGTYQIWEPRAGS